MSSSLSRFSGWRSRSLSLGEGLTDLTGARDGTRAAWCVGSRAAPAFSFLVFCLAAPSSYRVDRGRHLALSTFAGGLNVELSLPIFRLALAVFIPWRGADGFDRRAGWHPRCMVCWIEGGAGFFIFSVLPGGAVELPGRSRPAPGVVDIRRGAQCRALSPDFPAGARSLYPLARG